MRASVCKHSDAKVAASSDRSRFRQLEGRVEEVCGACSIDDTNQVSLAVRLWCCRDLYMAHSRAGDQALAEVCTKCHAEMVAFACRGCIREMEGENVAQEKASSCSDANQALQAA